MCDDHRNFYNERLMARISELRQLHDDDLKFNIEVGRLFEATAQTRAERMEAQQMLGALRALAKFPGRVLLRRSPSRHGYEADQKANTEVAN